jgi:hypothetical protein
MPHCIERLFSVDGVLIYGVDECGGDIEVDLMPGRAMAIEGLLCIGLALPEIHDGLPRAALARRIMAASATKGDYALSKEGSRWLVWKNYTMHGERFLEEALVAHARFTRALSSALRCPPAKRAAPSYF